MTLSVEFTATEQGLRKQRDLNISKDCPYTNYMDIKFWPLEVIDIPALVSACADRWYIQTLSKVNDSVIRLDVMQGGFVGQACQ
ncbi:MAG: hypothetical protein OEU36_22495 [Gammaproteobacteria bacterium]|nr:hypothetical protein [Gammaproteobacteria bacterium]